MTTAAWVFAGVLGAGAFISAVVAIFRGLRWLWTEFLNPAVLFFRDWLGEQERPGISPGRPGVMVRITTLEEGQTKVVDAINDLKAVVRALEEKLAETAGQQPNAVVTGIGFQTDRSSSADSTSAIMAGRRQK